VTTPGELQVIRWENASATRVDFTGGTTAGGIALHVSGGCIEEARYALASPGFVATTSAIRAPCSDPVAATMRPRADLSLRLLPSAGLAAPTTAAIELAACNDARDSMIIPFLLRDDHTATVPVPAGCFLPTLHAGTFASFRLPQVQLTAGDVLHAAPIRLSPGATLTARVMSGTGHPVVNAQVRLLHTEDVDNASKGTDSIRAVRNTITDQFGWVKVIGLPAGKYVLEISLPNAQKRLTTPMFTIRPQEQFFLNDIALPADE
jgi:hypothetical protein